MSTIEIASERDRLGAISVAGRIDRLREHLAHRQAPSRFVATAAADVRWLTGFAGSTGYVVVTPDRAVLITDPRYGERAEGELAASSSEAEIDVVPSAALSERVTAVAGPGPIGVDPETVTWATVEAWTAGAEIVAVDAPVLGLRRIKDGAEIQRMRLAAAIADAALAEVAADLSERPTELEVARRLDRSMEDHGADGPGYPTIVAAGPNAAVPHARAGNRVIGDGDTVIIDVGAAVDGYRSDMTRSFAIGTVAPDAVTWFDAVRAAADAARQSVRPGVTGRALHAIAVGVLDEAGLADRFIHGLGHGVGLVIHEPPMLSRSDDELEVGQVITIEPGVYVPGRGGVRWEDLVVVTDTGHEVLTASPKDPDPTTFVFST